jgi:hypothetical protein
MAPPPRVPPALWLRRRRRYHVAIIVGERAKEGRIGRLPPPFEVAADHGCRHGASALGGLDLLLKHLPHPYTGEGRIQELADGAGVL